MSLYNMLNGVNPATFYFLPMLGKHPNDIPRFRDCFINSKNQIMVFTRVGGGNRNCGFGEEVLCQHPDFVETYDDENDNTYGYYIFNVPEKWKSDFERIRNKKRSSDEYIEQNCSIYPKIADRLRQQFETLDRI